MPRKKPSDVTQIKIRVREGLRRALEAAAKKRDVSINFEMTERLKASLDQDNLVGLSVWERFARNVNDQLLAADLVNAAEHLIAQLPAEVREGEPVKNAIEWVQKAMKAITDIHGRTYTHEPE